MEIRKQGRQEGFTSRKHERSITSSGLTGTRVSLESMQRSLPGLAGRVFEGREVGDEVADVARREQFSDVFGHGGEALLPLFDVGLFDVDALALRIEDDDLALAFAENAADLGVALLCDQHDVAELGGDLLVGEQKGFEDLATRAKGDDAAQIRAYLPSTALDRVALDAHGLRLLEGSPAGDSVPAFDQFTA